MVKWWVWEELGKKIYWQNKTEVLLYLHTGLFLLNLYIFPNFSYIFFLWGTNYWITILWRSSFSMHSYYLFLFHLQLLELWCPVPAATTSCPWFTRYILPERFVSLDWLNYSVWFSSDIHLSFMYSSFHHKGASRRLCWAGEACTRIWWLWFQGVWNFLYIFIQ